MSPGFLSKGHSLITRCKVDYSIKWLEAIMKKKEGEGRKFPSTKTEEDLRCAELNNDVWPHHLIIFMV